MSTFEILTPLFVQVLLTFVLVFWNSGLRFAVVNRGEVHPRDIALRQPNWPKRVTQIGNSYLSQFELPVLFYVLTILALITRQADFTFVVLAWVFVLSRLGHAYIHVTSNRIIHRFAFFAIGAIALAIAWLIFMLRVSWVY